MKIKKKLQQHRRDFTAVYVCEHCNKTEEGAGYDDNFFHMEVIPKMECKSCGKTSGPDYKPQKTKYSADTVI